MSNTWWEICITCVPNLEESIFWRLEQFGCSGTATEAKLDYCSIRAYIPQIQAQKSDLERLAGQICQDAYQLELPKPTIYWLPLEEEDWSKSWKKDWQPTPIGNRFLIYPAWLSPPRNSDRLILRVDPGIAFGTGDHPTTQLCLQSLERYCQNQPQRLIIADLGCGSGILSIGAILLGVQQVSAVDIDPLAVKATNSNRELNQIKSSRLILAQGSIETLEELAPEGYDGFVCNILAEVILTLIPHFSVIAKAKSWGILSGILVKQAESVTNALAQHGWVVVSVEKLEDWCCLNIRREKEYLALK